MRRSREVQQRLNSLEQQQDALIAQSEELSRQNALSEQIIGFAAKVASNIDHLDFDQRQKLLRLVVEQVRVQGWKVDIMLRIPLNETSSPPDPSVSSIDRLRSVGSDCRLASELA